MKTYKHLMEQFLSVNNIRLSIYTGSKNKLKRPEMRDFRLNEEKWIRYYSKHAANWDHRAHTPVIIRDGCSGKERSIVVPTNREQIFHHMIVNTLKPMFYKGMYEHSYSAIPKRGPEKGMKAIRKWIEKDPKGCKYILKLDIKHFFATIPHEKLKEKLAKNIHDDEFLKILYDLIDSYDSYEGEDLPYEVIRCKGSGIPLGFYTSQWLSNWYLQDLDHYIKERLRVPHYARYADDMVLFGASKRFLHKARKAIDWYLKIELGLDMKYNWQIFKFDYIDENGNHQGRDLDFMGYRFYCDRVTMRKRILYRAVKKANKLAKKEHPTVHDARQMLSRLGRFKHSQTYGAYKDLIKPKVNVKRLKNKVSASDKAVKKEKRYLYDGMAKCSEHYQTGGDRHYLLEEVQLYPKEYYRGDDRTGWSDGDNV